MSYKAMKYLSTLILIACAALLPSAALGHAMLICHVGGPGTTEQAAPSLALFLRHLEKTAGFPANSFEGEYLLKEADCAAYLAEKSPLMVVADLPTVLRNYARWKLEPVAHVGDEKSLQYHVLAQEGQSDLQGLKGGTLAVSGMDDEQFLARIVFAGKVKPTEHFKLQKSRRVLKGVRGVARGKYDAVLVDQAAFGHLGDLDLPVKLVEVHRSEPLPGLTLAVHGEVQGDRKKAVRKIEAALSKLCEGEGEKLCHSLEVGAFTKVKKKALLRLLKRYQEK